MRVGEEVAGATCRRRSRPGLGSRSNKSRCRPSSASPDKSALISKSIQCSEAGEMALLTRREDAACAYRGEMNCGWKAPPCQTCPDRLRWLRGHSSIQILNLNRFHSSAAEHVHDLPARLFHEVGGRRNTQSSHSPPRFQTIRQLVNGQKVNSKIL